MRQDRQLPGTGGLRVLFKTQGPLGEEAVGAESCIGNVCSVRSCIRVGEMARVQWGGESASK